MKRTEYQTLKKRQLSLDECSTEIVTVNGYNFFINDILFFVYNEVNYGWIVVDPNVGIAFSKHFQTRSLAIQDAKNRFEEWLNYKNSDNYQKLIDHYLSIKNEIVKGQMSIYDYE